MPITVVHIKADKANLTKYGARSAGVSGKIAHPTEEHLSDSKIKCNKCLKTVLSLQRSQASQIVQHSTIFR